MEDLVLFAFHCSPTLQAKEWISTGLYYSHKELSYKKKGKCNAIIEN